MTAHYARSRSGSLLLAGGRLGDLLWTQAAVHRQHDRILAPRRGRRRGTELRRARGRHARTAGRVRRADGNRGASSLASTTFTDPRERATAFGIWGAIGGIGAADRTAARRHPHPRPVVAVDAARQPRLRGPRLCSALPRAPAPRRKLGPRADRRPRDADRDGPASVALVYGFAHAQNHGWGSSTTIAFLAAGAVLLCSVRRDQSPRRAVPAAAAARRARAQPGPGPTWPSALSAWAPSASSCSRPTTCRRSRATRPAAPDLAFLPPPGQRW